MKRLSLVPESGCSGAAYTYMGLRVFLRLQRFFLHVSLPCPRHISTAQLFSDMKTVCGVGSFLQSFPPLGSELSAVKRSLSIG